ncbi:hypothetical protein [Streptomyces griseosporeus]|uniref:hypothetical protein n=1 Tax=Streptomyces griseosporeus TaxID=1910 RepID=UPI0037009296
MWRKRKKQRPGAQQDEDAGTNRDDLAEDWFTAHDLTEMRRLADEAVRARLQRELRRLAVRVRADAQHQEAGAQPGWRAGVEWTLLWIENTATQLRTSPGTTTRTNIPSDRARGHSVRHLADCRRPHVGGDVDRRLRPRRGAPSSLRRPPSVWSGRRRQ